ncbi:hypothetical protein PIB30_004055 [Stylosanthes scabra]|uniref:Uncharacterized protein n=1 Tax=Stylosanthes scabra TaxID=79078 RepID=A0ABU6Y209_9FABA|nr:hypothetical protein [Stylosanthes scabra]
MNKKNYYSIRDVEMVLNNNNDAKFTAPGTPTFIMKIFIHLPLKQCLTNGNILSSGKQTEQVTPFSKRTNRFAVKFSINTVLDPENEKQAPDHE